MSSSKQLKIQFKGEEKISQDELYGTHVKVDGRWYPVAHGPGGDKFWLIAFCKSFPETRQEIIEELDRQMREAGLE